MIETGIQNSLGQSIATPLPISWLGRSDMPPPPLSTTNIDALTQTQSRNLQAQIAYDLSEWDYAKVGTDNAVGRYQFAPTILEAYGVLAPGSNQAYGVDCVNHTTCWRPVPVRNKKNGISTYLNDNDSLTSFLTDSMAQEKLAYQISYDLYNGLVDNGGITALDTVETVAGMISVAWGAGVTAAYTWRYRGTGSNSDAYNSGRYAVTVLSQ